VAVASAVAYVKLQTDNHESTSTFKFFYRPDVLPDGQPCQSTEGILSACQVQL